jgi:hypothetical protein
LLLLRKQVICKKRKSQEFLPTVNYLSMPPKTIKSLPQKITPTRNFSAAQSKGEKAPPPYQLHEGDEDTLKNTRLLVHAKDGDEFANPMHDMGLTLEHDSSVTNKMPREMLGMTQQKEQGKAKEVPTQASHTQSRQDSAI